MPKLCPIGPRLLSLAVVTRFEREARAQGVSEVARSLRGFLTAYKNGKLDSQWCRRRAAFIKRHMAQVRKRNEPLWNAQGRPTRRHLALVMWAYSPTRRW